MGRTRWKSNQLELELASPKCHKIFGGCQRMAKVPNVVEILPKISTAWVGRTNVTDDRQTTDGREIAYSERERELTFANKM